MKNKLQNLLKHNWRTLLLLFTLITTSQGVWAAQTYYVYGGTTQHSGTDLLGWNTPITSATGDDSSFDVSIPLAENSKDADYYYGICRSSSKFLPNSGAASDYNDHIIPDGISGSLTGVDIGKEGINAGSCHFYTIKIKKTSDGVSSVTLHFAKTGNNYSQCSQTQKGWNVTISGESVDSWSLRGEFTDWNTNPVIFTKSGDVYSASVDLPASTTYQSGTQGKGFKIVKNGSDWYGITSTTITSANALTAKNFTQGSGDSYNCGLTTSLAGTYTFNFTLNNSGNPQVTVTYPSKLPTVPTVRWGKAPSVDGSKNIKATAYVAAQGCDGTSQQSVTKIRIRFWKEDEESGAQILTTSEGLYTINNLYDVTVSGVTTIPATNNVLMSCTTPTYIYMEVAGYSEKGWSDYSDRVKVLYTANNEFVTNDLSPDFTACEGMHELTFSDMVLPVPDSWSAVEYGTSTDATSLFTLVGDVLTWDNTGKTTGTCKYTFTFVKDGYPNGSATLAITYTQAEPTADITDITATPSVESPVKPYTDIALATTTSGNITNVEWYVKKDKTRVILTPSSDGSGAVFRAKPYTSTKTYTVFAKGLTESCGATAEKSIEITVEPNSEICPAP
ncbi:MAG: hypothetical protein IJR06_05190 [Paludibacteraceae bacterium]|nr:hypothetical protein [Paludibacteraceae bacterium]